MTTDEWNARYPIGTRVRLTLADGETRDTRTLTAAQTWGGLDHVCVAGVTGYVLLSWVEPANSVALD
jgi:hypothetical protein